MFNFFFIQSFLGSVGVFSNIVGLVATSLIFLCFKHLFHFPFCVFFILVLGGT